jgi:hypothetical protein
MENKLFMKNYLLALIFVCLGPGAFAQLKEDAETKSFKENLFTGGSISLSFFNRAFLVGASPVFGYSLTSWADLGIVANYNYTSYRDYDVYGDRLHQTVYGGGVFTRLFPARFLFAQGQVEHNWIRLKYTYPYGGGSYIRNTSANSVLVGAGYTTGRDPDAKGMYWYLAILFDVAREANSPYTDNLGRAVPIIRAGLNVPLFQGRGRR